jgi:hypothetical protein
MQAGPLRARRGAAMEEEGGFAFGRSWSGSALASWPSYAVTGAGGNGTSAFSSFGLGSQPAEAPLAARWRAALGLEEEPAPSPSPPPGLLRSGSALLLPATGNFSSLFDPLPLQAAAAPQTPFDWSAPAAVCNTPTAAAALSLLGGRAPRGTPLTQQPGSSEATVEVECGSPLLRGHLYLDAPPLRIRLDNGAVLGPLDFEKAAGCDAAARFPASEGLHPAGRSRRG